MPSERWSSWLRGDSRVTAFVFGTAAAIALFAFFGWDLMAHHWIPYVPNRPESSFFRLLPAVIWLAAFLRASLRWLRRRQSRYWPYAQSTIEGGSITDAEGRSCLLTVAYSYFVNGERYGGVYAESFRGESDAQAVFERLRRLPPPVRYKPGSPAESTMEPYCDAALATRFHGAEQASS